MSDPNRHTARMAATPLTPSTERLRGTALRFLRRFGLVAALWSTLLAAAVPAPGAADRVVMWTGVGLLWVWALASQVVRRPVVWWWGWLLTASGMELLGPLAGTDGWSLVGGASFIVLAGVALAGRRTWVVATVAWLSVIAIVRGVVAAGWNVGGGVGTLLIFAFGALALTWLFELLQGSMAERDRLQAALVDVERQRVREAERAESAARLHDTVLQHLTAVDHAGELGQARRHAGRARNELRQFLRADAPATGSFRSALEEAVTAAADGVEVSVGMVGARDLGDRQRLLVEAAAEAVRNAARHASPPIRVFGEVTGTGGVTVWVADRGDGFDPDEIPADRLGVRESIVGRLQRAGGTAEVTTGPGGTEAGAPGGIDVSDMPLGLAARVGYAGKGVLHLLVGVLAVSLVIGGSEEDASSQGAIDALSRQPFGSALLVLVGFGLAGYAAFRFARTVAPPQGGWDGIPGWLGRLASFVRGLVYATLAVLAFRNVLGGSSGSGDPGDRPPAGTARRCRAGRRDRCRRPRDRRLPPLARLGRRPTGRL